MCRSYGNYYLTYTLCRRLFITRRVVVPDMVIKTGSPSLKFWISVSDWDWTTDVLGRWAGERGSIIIVSVTRRNIDREKKIF